MSETTKKKEEINIVNLTGKRTNVGVGTFVLLFMIFTVMAAIFCLTKFIKWAWYL
jgi:hypothetical protein